MRTETLELLVESIERQRKRISYLEDTFMALADAMEKDLKPEVITNNLIESLHNQSVIDEMAKVIQTLIDKHTKNMDTHLATNIYAIGSLVERMDELEKEVANLKRNAFVIYNV
jgi:membrane protease subunit (stomatin/prohibitin family)